MQGGKGINWIDDADDAYVDIDVDDYRAQYTSSEFAVFAKEWSSKHTHNITIWQ